MINDWDNLDGLDNDIEHLESDIDWDELENIFGGDRQLMGLAGELLESPPKANLGERERIKNMAISLDEWEVYL